MLWHAIKCMDSVLIVSVGVQVVTWNEQEPLLPEQLRTECQSSVVLLWTPANQLTWFNTQALHMEASVAQRSPNLYCIDRFTYMQRARGRHRGSRGLCWMVAGKAGSLGKMKWLFYFYSLTLPKFKGLEKKKAQKASEAERDWLRESSPVSLHLAFGIESEPAYYSVYHNTAGEWEEN